MRVRRCCRWVALATVTLAAACAAAPRATGARLTPVARRFTDEAFDSDLAVFRGLEQRATRLGVGATGTRRYLATRASEWLSLAREAYERNDRSAFPEDMLVLAERDLLLLEQGPGASLDAVMSSVLFPNDVRLFDDSTWGRALALRADADRVGAPDEIARAETVLLRQGNRILSGPACLSDADASRRAGAMLSAVERTRLNLVPTPPPADTGRQVVIDRPAPVPVPDSARLPRLPRRSCDAPDRLTGVPTSIHFASGQVALSVASRRVLDRAAEKLRDYPGVGFRLSAHNDARGGSARNQALSQRRVEAVAAYLAAAGIAASRLVRSGAVDEERPLTPGAPARDAARNGRVDIAYELCDGSELVPAEIVDDLRPQRARKREKE